MSVHSLQGAVNEVSTRPLLVCQSVNPLLALRPLDALNVSEHRLLVDEGAAEAVGIERRQVEARQGHELPGEAELAEVLAEGMHLRVRHARGIPVEGRRQVVSQVRLLARAIHALHAIGKAPGVLEDGLRSLGPLRMYRTD